MGSQVVGKDRSRLPGRETVGKVRRGEDNKEGPAAERRRKYTDLWLDLGKKE